MAPKKKTHSNRQNLAKANQPIASGSPSSTTPQLPSLEEKLAAAETDLAIKTSELDQLEVILATEQTRTLHLEEELLAARKQIESLNKKLECQKSRYDELYARFRVERRARQRGAARKEVLSSQIKSLHESQASQKRTEKELIANASHITGILQRLEKEHQKICNQLSITQERSQLELSQAKEKLTSSQKELKKSRAQATYFRKRSDNAAVLRKHAIAKASDKARERALHERSTHSLTKSGQYTEETRKLVHLLVQAGCSKAYIGKIIAAVLQSAGITATSKTTGRRRNTGSGISRSSVARIVAEGYIASQIQLGFEMREAEGKWTVIQVLLLLY